MDGTDKMKVMLYGFSSQNEALIGESLRARGNVEVAAWVASRVEAGGFGNINRCRLENFTPNRCPPDVFKKLQEAFAEFFFCRVRPKQMYLQSEKYYDYIDYFAEYANFFYDILDSRKIGAVFFANVPHIGADYVLYRLAKILGVKTFFFYQTLFPDKMICADGVESLGEYASKPRAGSGAPEIKNTFEKNLFYMHRGAGLLSKIKRKFRGLRIRRSAIVLTNILKFPFTAAYRFRMRRITKSGADMGKKFVYFAMHLQPEATTNPLGGIYADQALAIEHLRQILPDDWSIYVKENPYQDEFRRGRLFFKRLAALPNTIVVPPETNTYELLRNCQFAATITGTVGWEAISGGKKALVFGSAWYDRLPGVFKFSENFDLAAMLKSSFTHEELQSAFDALYGTFADGVVNQDYIKICPQFDAAKNAEKVAETIERLARA